MNASQLLYLDYLILLQNLGDLKRTIRKWVVFLKFLRGSGTPLQYSCLENPMDGGAW